MVKKKSQLVFYTFFILSIFLTSVVSAQFGAQYITRSGLDSALEDGPFVRALVFILGDFREGPADTTEYFLIKALVFILLFAVISVGVKRFPTFGDNRALSVLISLIVALIAVRYITSEALVNFIWLPYGVLGVFFATVFPFALGFLVIEAFDSSIFRKVSWSAYVVIFFGLAYLRWDDLAIEIEVITKNAWYSNLGVMYLAIAILSLLLIVFDKSVRAMMFRSSLKNVTDRKNRVRAARIANEIDELRNDLAGTSDASARASIKSEIAALNRQLDDLMRS